MGGGYKVYSIKKTVKNYRRLHKQWFIMYMFLSRLMFLVLIWLGIGARKEEQYIERTEELVIVVDKNGDLVGWTSYSLVKADKSTIVYKDSSEITPLHQKNKLMGRLFQKRVSDCITE